MKHTISVPLTEKGIDQLIKKLDEYEKWLKRKSNELAERLATLGATYASLGFSTALYEGERDVLISVEHRGDGHFAVKANGETVLIIEYGAGVTMGYGHPEVRKFGPGTYPGQTHAMDPHGWWYSENGKSRHTYGNPPNAPMYNTVKNLEQEFARIVREVFSD